jgi:hypothetical protein
MLSQQWLCSAYAQHILNVNIEMGSDFPLCWACLKIGYSLAEHARKLVTRWLSMRENRLLVCWACAKIGYSLAEHMQKLFWRSTCIFCLFFLFTLSPFSVPFSRPCLTSFMKIEAESQNLGALWKFRRISKIEALSQNLGGCLKFRRIFKI